MKKLKLPLIIFSAMLLQLTNARAQQVPQTLTDQTSYVRAICAF